MTDETQALETSAQLADEHRILSARGWLFLITKRLMDIVLSVLALPVVVLVGTALALLNPFFNQGALIYAQTRMGRNCRPFQLYKFRSMTIAKEGERGPADPVEDQRITPLGRFLRRTHIDEFPQFVNVLLGDMSIVGPRPDYWEHALHFSNKVPGYRQRHSVRPGITGLSQVRHGYAEGIDATFTKTRADLDYIANAGLANEAHILGRTAVIMLAGFVTR